MNSFDTVVLVRAMKKEYPDEDLFVERSVGGKLVIHPEDEVMDVAGFLLVVKKRRDVAVNPDHVITIFNKGDL
ncbi:MAG: hypothetical protein IKF82_00540 [Bacilli bacterium]|nr:hypothetical protein [Bacilli bacterium]